MKDIFIGGAWPYANSKLHIGHLAGLIEGDVLARYHREIGNRVIYVSGSDCHGTPITLRAHNEGIPASEIAETNHQHFVNTFKNMDFSYDAYGKTTMAEHEKNVHEIYLKLIENGHIYEKIEEQDFCETCDKFVSDREIVGTCPVCGGKVVGDQCEKCFTVLTPEQILDKHCGICGTKLVIKQNKHLYFKLSSFQNEIRAYVDQNKNNWRTNAFNESDKYLKMGLIDRATTRELDWGISTPVDGYEHKKIYVWIEAVIGYLTMGKMVCENLELNFDDYFKDRPDLETFYIHGKDNIVFHTIIFPALLLGLNKNWQLPKQIVSSEHVTVNSEKMSKSKGNVITVDELLEKFHKDSIRFYFVINNPEKKDSNVTINELVLQHNKFLVGVIGNFINRNVSYINKKFNGVFKSATVNEEVVLETQKCYADVKKLFETYEIKQALQRVVDYAQFANKFYDTMQPWTLAHTNEQEFLNVSYTCAYIIANFSNLLKPFLPSTADKISNILDIKNSNGYNEIKLSGDVEIKSNELLFARIEE